MPSARAVVTEPFVRRAHCRRARLASSLLATLWLASACDGALSHRSVAETAGTVPVGQGIKRLRIEIESGTVGIDSAEQPAAVAYAGGVRRAADTAEMLAALERMPITLSAVTDTTAPDTLVLRGEKAPAGETQAAFFYQLGIRVPADLAVEVLIHGSGHVTIANRKAHTRVKTGRGDLRFEGCAGGVKAETGRGVLIAFEHRGDLDVHTMVGDMQVFVREPGDLLRLVTGKGTVQCHVPPTIEFDLDARAEIGRIGNGFGLEATTPLQYASALVGRRGSARTKVVLRTGSGHLSFAPKKFE